MTLFYRINIANLYNTIHDVWRERGMIQYQQSDAITVPWITKYTQ